MDKTLPKRSIAFKNQAAGIVKSDSVNSQLPQLMQELSGVWKEAAADLLQPRPEAVAQLLKKTATAG